ncbi:MAG: hypothetical protein RDV48_00850 [Candidatus Eremiobacteraeota bacterium]|nr:hypothetical protein [Candidatus Eremiobacteraeota bacterium]
MSDLISSIDKLNALRNKYDIAGIGETGAQTQAAGGTQAQPSSLGQDGLSLTNEMQKNNQAAQQQQMQQQQGGDGSGAMWAAFGINLGLSILGKILGGGGGGGQEGGGDDQQQAGGCSGGGGG